MWQDGEGGGMCVCVVEYVYVARVCGLKYSQVCVP